MDDLEIINKLSNKKNIIPKYLDDDILEYAKSRYLDSDDIYESIYRIRNGIEIRPVCKTCGGKVKFSNGFNTYCCRACVHKDPEINDRKIKKYKNTCISKYGVQHVCKLDEVKEKIANTNIIKYGFACSAKNEDVKKKAKLTKLEKYGDENYNNIEKHKDTCLYKYGDENYTNREKYIDTCIKRYGVTNVFADENTKEKIKNTNKTKYGEELYVNSNDYKVKNNKTLLEKYGVTNILNSETVKAKIKNTVLQKYGVENVYQNKDIRKKCVENTRKTLNKKYGVNWISNIPGVSKKISEHGYKTKLKNGTLNTSIIEDKIKNYLIEHNIEFKQQYKSKEYPYSCDFYFPSKDLYVEIQAHWTHGGHPYNKNNIEDINIIEKWKAKNTKYFNNAINTWTVRDVNKRNTATQNNLNYVEIFSNNLDKCIGIIIEKLK